MRPGRVGLCIALQLAFVVGLRAHESRPGFLELRETDPEVWEVVWKVPARGDLRLSLSPRLPDSCRPLGESRVVPAPGAFIERWRVSCPEGLRGELAIVGLRATLTDVLLRIQPALGPARTFLLRSSAPAVVLGDESVGSGVSFGYLILGVEHILLGIDHLLFVLGLLLIVKKRRTLVKTITSFTLAHSITLAVATLGWASAPEAPLNAAIALSILFLGPEVVRKWRGESSLTIRHPWLVAFAFGLLHGFGFASGLTTIGLPQAEIPLALLFFNVGVEVGQLGFVLLVLALERSFRNLDIVWPVWARALPGYAVGSLGAFWAIQRTAMMVGMA